MLIVCCDAFRYATKALIIRKSVKMKPRYSAVALNWPEALTGREDQLACRSLQLQVPYVAGAAVSPVIYLAINNEGAAHAACSVETGKLIPLVLTEDVPCDAADVIVYEDVSSKSLFTISNTSVYESRE